MPINTAAKRYSAINLGNPWRGVNIQPVGAIDGAARLAIAYLYSGLPVQTPVEVPGVVGETQEDGTSTLEGAGFVVAVATDYSNTVPAGSIISQQPAGGSQALPGSTVTITVSLGDEPVSEKGAGRKKRRRRLLVEIDGQEFEVSSPQAAVELLGKAREVAEKAVEKARTLPVRVDRGIQRPRISTNDPELRQVVAQARREIVSLYDGLSRDIEIAALMARKIEDEEEEELIRLLM